MNVFLAWSGTVSQKTAEALHTWLPAVLQKLKPFLSSTDIGKGDRWRNELARQVESAKFAILCLSPDNLQSPWIHFEAGAVSRQANEGRVSALLVGVKGEQVRDPLSQFQNTAATKEDVKKLVQKLNSLLEEDRLADGLLDVTFEMFWPQLEKALEAAQAAPTAKAAPARSQSDILAEVLENSRAQIRMISESLSLQAEAIREARSNRSFRVANLDDPATYSRVLWEDMPDKARWALQERLRKHLFDETPESDGAAAPSSPEPK